VSRLVWIDGHQYDAIKRAKDRLDRNDMNVRRNREDSDRLQKIIEEYDESRAVGESDSEIGFTK
jgi:hypothetical protein